MKLDGRVGRRALAIDESSVLAVQVSSREPTLTECDARMAPRDPSVVELARSFGAAAELEHRVVVERERARHRDSVGKHEQQPRPSIWSTWYSERARWEGCWIHDPEIIAD